MQGLPRADASEDRSCHLRTCLKTSRPLKTARSGIVCVVLAGQWLAWLTLWVNQTQEPPYILDVFMINKSVRAFGLRRQLRLRSL